MSSLVKPEQSCQNCRYYSQHYTKQGITISTVHCGHCLNRNNKKMRPLELCEYWEDIAIKKEERRRKIKEALIFMSERLSEIYQILKDDSSK